MRVLRQGLQARDTQEGAHLQEAQGGGHGSQEGAERTSRGIKVTQARQKCPVQSAKKHQKLLVRIQLSYFPKTS